MGMHLTHLLARNRNVTICPLVQVLSGEKAVALVPVVTPFSTAQATACAYSASASTSVKDAAFDGAGLPVAIHIYVTAIARVHGALRLLVSIPKPLAHAVTAARSFPLPAPFSAR